MSGTHEEDALGHEERVSSTRKEPEGLGQREALKKCETAKERVESTTNSVKAVGREGTRFDTLRRDGRIRSTVEVAERNNKTYAE